MQLTITSMDERTTQRQRILEFKKMPVINLLEKYPNLIEVCQKYDCNYSEAIKMIESNEKLIRFIQ